MQTPRTIHDFGGFPRQLFQYQYPAPGDPGLAKRTRELLAPLDVELDESWGLDHGTWSVLCHVFPGADVPVVQLCIDETKPASFHYKIGQRLRALRDEGILVLGSGDIVHNLHAYAWGMHSVEPYDWALRFEAKARELIIAGDHEPLINYESLGKDALLSVPTPEHYLPLLYILGASASGERATFPVEGIDGGFGVNVGRADRVIRSCASCDISCRCSLRPLTAPVWSALTCGWRSRSAGRAGLTSGFTSHEGYRMRFTDDHVSDALDAALEMTFPASDPVAVYVQETDSTRRPQGSHYVEEVSYGRLRYQRRERRA